MQVVDTSIVNVAIPTMMGNLGTTLTEIGWVSTGYMIANVIVLPLTGWLSATFGRRRYLAASMVLFTIASFFCGTSHTLAQLVVFRVIQGAGGAALLSTAQATLMEIFPPGQQGMIQAIFGIGVMAGPTVGPTLGGWITDNYSWPWIFFINLPIGAVAITLTLLFMHDSRHQAAHRGGLDAIGIGFLAVGLGCLQTMLEEGNTDDWFESPFICWMAALAAVGLVAFVIRELTARNPAVKLRVLKNRGLAAGTVFGAIYGFGLYGGVFIMPVFLQEVRGYTAQQSGIIMLPGAIATTIMLPIVGRLLGKIAPHKLAIVGVAGVIVSMWMLSLLTMDTGPDQLFWPLVLRGAALGAVWTPLTLATLSSLAPRDLAGGTGLYNLSRQLGGSAGIACLTTFVDHRTAFHRSVLVEHVTRYDLGAQQRLAAFASGMMAKGAPVRVAQEQADALVDRVVQGQATIMAFEDCFLLVGVVFLMAMPLLFLFKRKRELGGAPEAALAD
jgi:DHA2 family multidrug resistance protein